MKALVRKILNKDLRILLRRLFYCGAKYHCNVCNNNVRTMFDSGYQFSGVNGTGRDRW